MAIYRMTFDAKGDIMPVTMTKDGVGAGLGERGCGSITVAMMPVSRTPSLFEKNRKLYHLSMRLYRRFTLIPLGISILAIAQNKQNTEPLNLVMPGGLGRIVLPSRAEMPLELIAAYDDGQRPVAQFADKSGLAVSYILFHNLSGDPSGRGCREDVIEPLLRRFGSSVSNLKRSADSEITAATPVTAAYFIESMDGHPIHQQNLFGFVGDAKTCLEIHISKTSYKASDDGEIAVQLATLKNDLTYIPTAKDYFLLATILFKKAPASAAPYYQSARTALPPGTGTLQSRRVITDQLAMSLGMSGNIKASREVLESAVQNDPDYPLNYYNLACADAEQGDATTAKIHLQQAFERKNNTIRGESLPDPTKDDSLLKLKTIKRSGSLPVRFPLSGPLHAELFWSEGARQSI